MAVGLFDGASGGLIGTIALLGSGGLNIFIGVIAAISTAMTSFCLFMGVYLIQAVARFFRSGGHSVESAGAQVGQNIANNQTFRRTAKDTVMNAV